VNMVHYDKRTKSTVVDSTLKITTNFSITTDAKGKVKVSASSQREWLTVRISERLPL